MMSRLSCASGGSFDVFGCVATLPDKCVCSRLASPNYSIFCTKSERLWGFQYVSQLIILTQPWKSTTKLRDASLGGVKEMETVSQFKKGLYT